MQPKLANTDGKISIPLGIFIGLLASFIQSLGLTIQRKSHVLNGKLPESQQKLEHRRPLWLLGFAIFISSNIIGSLVQIASLPVVILAPLGAVSLLWNAFFARFILGDVFSVWMILGTILIAGGAVLIAIFGIVPEPTRSLEDLLFLFRRPVFVAYFSLLGAVVVVCLVITHIVEFSLKRKLAAESIPLTAPPSPTTGTPAVPATPAVLTTGVTEEITNEETPLLSLDRKNTSNSNTSASSPESVRRPLESPAVTRTRLLIAISYASFSGIISGMCLLFAKSGVELLLLTVKGHNQFWRWESWMLLVALVAFALLQLWYLHKGLTLADPTLVCPSAFCFYNLSSIFNGLIYFDQFGLISPLHLGLVGIGILVLLAGVWVVSIQAGGGGIDVDRWEGSDEPQSDTSSLSESQDIEGRDVEEGTRATDHSQSVFNRRGRPSTFGPVRMDRQSVSESHMPSLAQSPPSRHSLRIRAPTLDEVPALNLPLTSPTSPHSPPARRGTTPDSSLLLSPTTGRIRKRRRPTLPSDQQSFSPPLGGGSVLGGLSIGIGPMSPGFSIVPRERRSHGRRVSGFGDVVDSARMQRRRTVSEGDIRPWEEGGGQVEGGSGVAEPGTSPETTEEESGGKKPANKRWNWVRRVFLNRR